MNKGPYLSGLEFTGENRAKGEFFFDEGVLEQVLRRCKPTTWFWCDMTDMFGEWVPVEWQDRCFATMVLTPQHNHFVLTKRALQMQEYIEILALSEVRLEDVYDIATDLAHSEISRTAYLQACADGLVDRWPLLNIRLGVSVEDQQRADERIPELMKLAAMGWKTMVSAEPLLGPINLDVDYADGAHALGCGDELHEDPKCKAIGWVIVGGESGPGARPCDLAWIRSIIQQCEVASVPCFVKQLGARTTAISHNPESSYIRWKDRKGGDPSEWPEDLRVRQMPEAHQ
jgi:protein gp37